MIANPTKMLLSIILATALSTMTIPQVPGPQQANGSECNIYVLDTAVDPHGFTSLAFDSNDNPHISYTNGSNYGLKYARWTGSDWSIETVDPDGSVRFWTSIAMDSSDNPHIS